MKMVFPSELAILQANAGSPVDLMRIQNEAMWQALEENRVRLRELRHELGAMNAVVQRRTAVLSPAKAYSHQTYTSSGMSVPLLFSLLFSPPYHQYLDLLVLQIHWCLLVLLLFRLPLHMLGMTLRQSSMTIREHQKTQVFMKQKIMLFEVSSVRHLLYQTLPGQERK
jgi:hypothetical protein